MITIISRINYKRRAGVNYSSKRRYSTTFAFETSVRCVKLVMSPNGRTVFNAVVASSKHQHEHSSFATSLLLSIHPVPDQHVREERPVKFLPTSRPIKFPLSFEWNKQAVMPRLFPSSRVDSSFLFRDTRFPPTFLSFLFRFLYDAYAYRGRSKSAKQHVAIPRTMEIFLETRETRIPRTGQRRAID